MENEKESEKLRKKKDGWEITCDEWGWVRGGRGGNRGNSGGATNQRCEWGKCDDHRQTAKKRYNN